MKLSAATVLADAWGLWKRDRDLLLRIAPLFLFLPMFALYVAVPSIPILKIDADMSEADQLAQAKIYVDWVGANGHWYVIAVLLMHFGQLVLLALYLDPARPDLRAAMIRAVGLFARYLLAMILIGIPASIGFLVILLLLPGLYLLGRMIAVAPAIVAERPLGVLRAIRRSFDLTKGNGLILAGFAAIPLFGGIIAEPFRAIDRSLRAAGSANPVAIALVDAAAAGISAAALLAMVLVQVAIYRRMASSRGT